MRWNSRPILASVSPLPISTIISWSRREATPASPRHQRAPMRNAPPSSRPISRNARGIGTRGARGKSPIERPANRGLDPELCKAHPAPEAADLPDPDQQAREQSPGLVANAVPPEQIGEVQRPIDVARLQLQHLSQQHHGKRTLPLLAQHRASLQQREHGVLPLAALHLLVRDPLPVLDLLGERLRRHGPDRDGLGRESHLEVSVGRLVEVLAGLVPTPDASEKRRELGADYVVRRLVLP